VIPLIATNEKLSVISIFALAYFFIILFYNWKTIIVWTTVALLLILHLITLREALGAIEWNVLFLYFGMLFVSEVFLISKMPDYLATLVAGRTKSTGIAMVIICVFTGFLSIMLENVAVVLLVAPIALAISRKADIHPVPLFIGMAVSSNLQGAATLIGDPPSMLLAGAAGLMSIFVITEPLLLLVSMVGVGIAWASILSMPYAILTGSLPPSKMGYYMGVFNFFIVIPQIVAAAILGGVIGWLFDGEAIWALLIGGGSMVLAAGLTMADAADIAKANAGA